MSEELWKDIPDMIDYYQASNLGRIRRIERLKRNVSQNGKEFYSKLPTKILKFDKKINNAGYYNIVLCINAQHIYKDVHRLVALTFIPNPNQFKTVNHKDGNKLNNNINNLEWLSYKNNSKHAWELGLYEEVRAGTSNRSRGIKNVKAKLTENNVLQIRQYLKEGLLTQKAIGQLFNVSQSQVSEIKLNRCWKHI